MRAIKLIVAFVLLIAIFIGGFSVALAAATAPPSVPNEPATLTIESGTVETRTSSSAEWKNGTDGEQVFPGESLRTGAGSSASVNLFDQGLMRLDENTEITLTDTVWDHNNPTVFTGNIFLATGNLWSRLFTFVSPDSSFNVSTSSTVATVRGTVFSVTARPDGSAWVYVDNHAVQVKTRGNNEATVYAGQHAQVGNEKERFMLNANTQAPDDFQTWINKNRTKDHDFDQQVKARWIKKLRDPGSFVHMAERLRLAGTRDHKMREVLRNRFMLRQKLLERFNDKQVVIPPKLELETTSNYQILINGVPLRDSSTTPLDQPTDSPIIQPRLY